MVRRRDPIHDELRRIRRKRNLLDFPSGGECCGCLVFTALAVVAAPVFLLWLGAGCPGVGTAPSTPPTAATTR